MFSDTLAAANALLQPYIQRIQFLIDYCPANELRNRLCHEFWSWTILFPISLIAIALIWYLINCVKDHRAMQRLEKMKADQLIVADKEILERHKWKGLDNNTDTTDEAELAERIRQAIKQPVRE